MDLMHSINFALRNSPSHDPPEESLFTPPPDPKPRQSPVFVSVPAFPAGLTRDSYRLWPRPLKRARPENPENRQYAKYDHATDKTTLSIGWLDEHMGQVHTVQAVNLLLRGFNVDIRAPKSSNHAFPGFPLPNYLAFDETGDVKTCAMSGWDGLPSPGPSQPSLSKSATPPHKPTSRSKQKRVYIVFDSDNESQARTNTRPRKKAKLDPQETFAASLSAAYNQSESTPSPIKDKRPVKRVQHSQERLEYEYQYALGDYIPFVDDPKDMDDDFVPTSSTGKPKKRTKTVRDSTSASQGRLEEDHEFITYPKDSDVPPSTPKSKKRPKTGSVNGHDEEYTPKRGKARRIIESDDEEIPFPMPSPKPKSKEASSRPKPKPLQRILHTPKSPVISPKVGPPTKQVPPPLTTMTKQVPPPPPYSPPSYASISASASASGSVPIPIPIPIGPPPKRRTKIPPPAANIARPRLVLASHSSPAALSSPPSHHTSDNRNLPLLQSPGVYGYPQQQQHQQPRVYGNNYTSPPSRYGSGEKQKRRGFYASSSSAVSFSASPTPLTSGSTSTSGSLYRSASVTPILTPNPPTTYSSYSSLVSGGVAANGTVIVRKPQSQHQQQQGSAPQTSWWSSWTPVGSPSPYKAEPQEGDLPRGDADADVVMQDPDLGVETEPNTTINVNDVDQGIFGNGTIDPRVFAPPAVESSADPDEEIDEDGDLDVDAEGDTDPEEEESEVVVFSTKRIRKPSRRYGEDEISPSSSGGSASLAPPNDTHAQPAASVTPTSADTDPSTPATNSGPFPRVDIQLMDKSKGWPPGDEMIYCHCCRTKPKKAQMFCGNLGCSKSYCVRCLAIRFPYLDFDAERKDWECFVCLDRCPCDHCCRKRGDVFYPLRGGRLVDPIVKEEEGKMKTRVVKKPSVKAPGLETPKPKSKPKPKGKGKAATVPIVPEEPPPPPLVFRDIEEPTKHWGLIYDVTGRRIGEAFMGADGRDDVVLGKWDFPLPNPPLQVTFTPLWKNSKRRRKKRKRVFVGKVQEEGWGECVSFREHPEDDYADGEGEEEEDGDGDGEVKKDVVGYRRPGTISQDGKVVKWYVGKKGPLFWRPVAGGEGEGEDEDEGEGADRDGVQDRDGDGDGEPDHGRELPTEENPPLLPKVEEVLAVSCSVPVPSTDSPLTALDSSSGEGEYCVRFGGEDSDAYIKSPASRKRNEIEAEAEAESHASGLDHNALLTAIVLGLKEVGRNPIYYNL